MKSRRKKIELGDALENYFSPSIGQIPITIIDTSTVIDLEEKSRDLSHRASGELASALLEDLAKLSHYVVIPDNILYEIKRHHLNGTKNGRPEISRALYDSICGHAASSEKIIVDAGKFLEFNRAYSETFENLSFLAEKLHDEINEGKKLKKIRRDPISTADLELINLSLKLAVKSSAHLDKKVAEKGDVPDVLKDTYRIAVLSADSHIYKPINKILETSEGLNYRNYLFAFNTREYL